MSDTYQVNEIFSTIQGEGVLAGKPATFIRLQGCTVGCPWCDTKYTWAKGGRRMPVEEIIGRVKRTHVVITGGEPTLYNLDSLLLALHQYGYFTQLETSGQQWMKGELVPKWVTWSPKANLNYLAPKGLMQEVHEVKWVVDEDLHFEVLQTTWNRIQSMQRRWPVMFVLMPEGCPPRPEMVEKALIWLNGLRKGTEEERHWRYGDRIQYRIGVP